VMTWENADGVRERTRTIAICRYWRQFSFMAGLSNRQSIFMDDPLWQIGKDVEDANGLVCNRGSGFGRAASERADIEFYPRTHDRLHMYYGVKG
jgi:hypothetical protein